MPKLCKRFVKRYWKLLRRLQILLAEALLDNYVEADGETAHVRICEISNDATDIAVMLKGTTAVHQRAVAYAVLNCVLVNEERSAS